MRFAAALVLIAALSGCANKTPEEKLLDQCSAALSWVPALQMTGEKWAANSVPDRFVSSAADAAEKAFASASEAVGASKASSGLRSRLAADIARGSEAANALRQAVRSHDRKSAPAIASRLALVQRDLEDLRESVEQDSEKSKGAAQ